MALRPSPYLIRFNRGRTKARDFPLPVSANTIAFLFLKRTGIA
jgi:hypothetical protein